MAELDHCVGGDEFHDFQACGVLFGTSHWQDQPPRFDRRGHFCVPIFLGGELQISCGWLFDSCDVGVHRFDCLVVAGLDALMLGEVFPPAGTSSSATSQARCSAKGALDRDDWWALGGWCLSRKARKLRLF